MFKRVNIVTFLTFVASLCATRTVVLIGCPSADADDDDSSVVDDDDSAADDDDSGE